MVMNRYHSLSRRSTIGLIGAACLGVTLAGCLDDDDEEAPGDENGEPDNGEADMEAIEDHLADANGWEGELQDHTGEDDLLIEVGDPDGGNNYMYDPVAPEIDTGTTVTWEWVDDSNHSVTDNDGSFDSGVETEYEFEHTFEEAGTYLYHCQPHRAQGHLGAIVVVE